MTNNGLMRDKIELNITKKEKIITWVASQGDKGARYTDIQRFIYEHNNGKGTFDPVENRGYYSCAFSQVCRYTKGKSKYKNYLMHGDGLTKMPNGRYYATRTLAPAQLANISITEHMLDWIFDNGPVSYTDMETEYKRFSRSNSFSHHLPNLSNQFTTRPCSRFIIKDTTSGRRGLWQIESNHGWSSDEMYDFGTAVLEAKRNGYS